MENRTKSVRTRWRSLALLSVIAGSSLPNAFAATQPYITSASPLNVAPGSVITITGTGLSGINQAWVGSAHDAGITNVSSTVVKITVPKDATTGSVGIYNGSSWGFTPQTFTVATDTSGAGAGSGTTTDSSASLAVKVKGNHLVDASGNTLQLRGVNVSGLESVAAQGWDPSNPWGNQTGDPTPNWTAIKAWKANVVRLPLNEASWLGYSCKDATGRARNPDPGANYKSTVAKTVATATAAGLYVILDLHWSAPGNFCPLTQNQMADADHSVSFWSSIAAQFKSSPNVMFELFNEPYVAESSGAGSDWPIIMKGGTATTYVTGETPYTVNYKWTVAGMQQMLTAVRNTGATNVVLIGAATWSQNLSQWVATRPNDPLRQIAAAWHPYPNSDTVGDSQAALPKFGSVAYMWAQSVLDAGFPIIITETGDHNASGTKGSPLLANLLPWSDARAVSYLGWTWNPWGEADNVLIKDAAGTPTDGYGASFKQHLTCKAAGNCSGTTAGSGGTPPPPVPPTPVPPTPPQPPTPPPTSTFWVYQNGVYNWGGDYSTAAVPNYRSTAGSPESGSYDIAMTLTGQYGLWAPYAGGTVPLWNFNATGYKYLTLDLKPTVANQLWQLYFMLVGDVRIMGANGQQTMVNLTDYGPAPVAGQWATYRIPLSVVLTQNSSGKAIYETGVYKFGLQDETGRTQNTWYIDNVGFTK